MIVGVPQKKSEFACHRYWASGDQKIVLIPDSHKSKSHFQLLKKTLQHVSLLAAAAATEAIITTKTTTIKISFKFLQSGYLVLLSTSGTYINVDAV